MRRIIWMLVVAAVVTALAAMSAHAALLDLGGLLKLDLDGVHIDVPPKPLVIGNSNSGNNDCNGVIIEIGNKDKCND